MITCDWCARTNHSNREATFIVVTGNIDIMIIAEWFICIDHADQLCQKRWNKYGRHIIAGVVIDVWMMNAINDQARAWAARQ